MPSPLSPAVFLDRDGTLNREVDYLADPEDLVLLPGVLPALGRLRAAGFRLVVVTNQSGVARGLFTEETLAAIHERLASRLAEGGVALDAVEVCIHHPTAGSLPHRRECDCRKPAPGMLLAARDRLGLDLARSWIVGDGERDLAAGAAVGVRGVLVGTGHGAAERARLLAEGRAPRWFAPDLAGAVDLVLREDGRE